MRGLSKHRNRVRRAAAVLALAMCIAALGGCMGTSPDDLYALPQLSEGNLKLQSAIDGVLASGAFYSAPTSGTNRQPIQQEDIDGDGVPEVLAFFSFTGSDKPLKIVVFQSGEDGEYREIARIEGDGSGIDSVSYLDMDRDGVMEIAVGWQIGPGINTLSVYSVKGWQISQIVNTNYSEFAVCDLDGDRASEIVVLRLSASDFSGEAERYSLASDGEVVTSIAKLYSGITALERIRLGKLIGGQSAIYVECTVGNGIVTDILTCRGGELENISAAEGAIDTLRSLHTYCRDVNGDGILDIPKPVPLPSAGAETTYYITEWYSFYSTGVARLVSTTYHNYTDSWYLILPRDWIGHFTLSRRDVDTGERMIVFSTTGSHGEPGEDFAVIYSLTGDNREERAVSDGRFVLLEEGETIFAAKLLVDPETFDLPLSRELLRSNFGFIFSEWITSET